jgi:CRISPR-associated protein Csb2
LRELEVAFQRSRRPSPGDAAPGPEAEIATSASTFANDWLTFEIVAHDLDFRAAPLACKALIKAVMSGYAAVAGRDGIPAWVSGHGGDGSPGKDPHLAAVPLAFAGFKHGDGALMGFALVPPVGRDDLLADPMFRKAMFAITASGADGRRILPLVVGRTGALDIALTFGTERASLNPERYLSVAKYWGTVTPLVLDRHVSGDDPQTEIEDLIADACGRSLGVRPKRVVAHKHSAIQGAPSAYPSGNAPRWTGWRVPETLKSRRLTHAVLEFEGDVAGPLMIGAGRFCGLGLCLPLGAPAE